MRRARIWADLTSDEDGEATRWVQCSRNTIWAASLLRRFTQQSLHSHSGALSFCNEYAALTGYDGSVASLRQRLMHTHLVWSCVRLHAELGTGDLGSFDFASEEGLDASLLRICPGLLSGFGCPGTPLPGSTRFCRRCKAGITILRVRAVKTGLAFRVRPHPRTSHTTPPPYLGQEQ